MATKKTTTSRKPKHSAFEAPTIGTVLPKGTTFKKNADGTVTPVFPKSTKGKDKK